MAAIATSKFRVHNAEQFVEQFSEASNTIIYMYIGGVVPFTDDFTPPTPLNDTANIEFVPWRDSIGAKRVQSTDVVHVIDRYDWTSATVYDMYDHTDTNILDDDFYVMTDEYNVYKCLYNNNGGASTTKPTGTSSTAFTTADGYVWKYMYTVTTSDALKFLTNEYMPVRTNATVQAAAVDGGLDIVKITSGGSSYGSAPSVSIVGDGSGATANVSVSGGAVNGVTITNAGTGYTTATVVFDNTGTGGSGAAATAIIPPRYGHGYNAVEELGGKFVMINTRLDGTESGTLSTENDFRKIGLIRDPFEYGTTTRALSSNYRQTHRYTVPAANGNFSLDETVTVGSNTATVVEWDNTNKYLYTTKPLPKDFANAATVTGGTSGVTGTITAVNNPGLAAYTGDILYVENRSPISRATDQIEDVKLIIEF
jgi:hypothetical protein